MCMIFAGQNPANYACETRSVRLGGCCTSIRLEAAFWATLDEIAAREQMSLAKFLTKLHDEVLELRGEVTNFASLLRCTCLLYARDAKAAWAASPAAADRVGSLMAAEQGAAARAGCSMALTPASGPPV
jgi:predicted DNA-binding ribbon-helix-helix protein